jgi:DNA-binding transcriptional regulator GbsR (MarR family)
MTKMTYVNAIDNILDTEEFLTMNVTEFDVTATMEKLRALKAQLEKRNGADGNRKPTKAQVANEGTKADILALLSAEGKQCKDIADALGISGQKCSALLKQLVDTGKAEKYTEKRVTYFKAIEG